MNLYHYARLTLEQQAMLWKQLRAELDADEKAGKSTLLKKYQLAAMYHILTANLMSRPS